MSAFQNKIYNLNMKQSEAHSRVTACKTEARFKYRSVHIIPPIKYMKRFTFESMNPNMSHLGQPMSIMN